jgi:membrane-associated protein
MMPTFHTLIDLFLHLNKHLNTFAGEHPVGVYGILVAIVFMETGLVVTPFLPGDSLLFAVGALAATQGSAIHLPLVIVLLCLAANCGDITNYFLGRSVGPRIFFKNDPAWNTGSQPDGTRPLEYETPKPPAPPLWQRLLSQKHLLEAHAFYERHGRKTIIIARFVPIIRTFAPFVAGIGKMTFSRFVGFSVFGGIFWVTSVTLAGYFFGGIPWVDKHFEVVVLAIIAISLLPMAFHALQKRPGGSAADVDTLTAR